MILLIEQFWPIILSAFGGIVAISKFYLDWLRIKEPKLKLAEAKKNNDRDSQSIVIATTEEIEKYGFQKFRSNSVTSILLVCFVSFVLLVINIIKFLITRQPITLNQNP
ncbi:hypothetical protein [Agarilytica rhodophyticola]|uniref:hypothetical protein n=1 Tax=Agarilytica rhodophyticola TaxID=1737490 RepID=UPI000B341ECE|nr:hypothetical protein [Agarilytica rhodophyticola]